MHGVLVDEGLLHRMQPPIGAREALDGRHWSAHRHGEGHAGEHPMAIDVHSAGAALTVVAALLGSGHAEPAMQGVEQAGARIDGQLVALTVDRKIDGDQRMDVGRFDHRRFRRAAHHGRPGRSAERQQAPARGRKAIVVVMRWVPHHPLSENTPGRRMVRL